MICKHAHIRTTGYRVRRVSRGNGRALPKWAVFQEGACDACNEAFHKDQGVVRALDEREAARLCGVPEADLPAAPPHSTSPAVEVPLTSWPFPVSAHKERRSRA